MDYIWKKNWAGRYYMDVTVSPVYKEDIFQKLQNTSLTDNENDRLNSLRSIIQGYRYLKQQSPEDVRKEYEILAKKASIHDVLRRELMELDLHNREQQGKFSGLRKRNRWGGEYYNNNM